VFNDINVKESVIIAGISRSGTSWIGKILDSLPFTLYKFEPFHPRFFPEIKEKVPYIIPRDQENASAEKALNDHVNRFHKLVSRWLNRPPFFKKSYRYPFVSNLLKYILPTSQQWILEHPIFFRTKQLSLVIKTIRSSFRLGWMDKILENTKFLYVMRHPLGNVNSIASLNWNHLSELLEVKKAIQKGTLKGFENLYKNFKGYDYLQKEALFWRLSVETALNDGKKIPYFKVIIYEELCNKPHQIIKEVFDFLDWELAKSTKNFVEESTKTHKVDPSSVYKESKYVASKWKFSLTKEEKEKIAHIVKDSWVIETYGYKINF